MFLRIDDGTRWIPDQHHAADNRAWRKSTSDLTPGALVIWERAPYRVAETRERDHTDWPQTFLDKWIEHRCPDPATWYYRPMTLTIRPEPETGAEPVHLLAAADHQWWTLPEHYAVCRLCGELPPCREVHTEAVMAVATKKMDAVMAILPGCCHACREPITKRQKTLRFEGANLIRPDMPDGSAIFHLREGCWGAAFRYDERWAAAGPERRRKLYCEGRRRNHYDGTAECTEGAQCPGKVGHRSEEWHRPVGGSAYTSGCWCVSGDLAARIAEHGGRGAR